MADTNQTSKGGFNVANIPDLRSLLPFYRSHPNTIFNGAKKGLGNVAMSLVCATGTVILQISLL
jgi:hypothetical protein